MPRPARPAASSARVVVVPTATTRRFSRLARLIVSAAASLIEKRSASTVCASTSIDAHRLKRAVADVQRDGRALDAPLVQRVEKLRREMQAGGRRRDRAALARIHGLIPLAIALRVVALDVRRQRHVADLVDRVLDARAALRPETDRPPAVKMPIEHLSVQHVPGAAEHHLRSGLQLLPGMHERVPSLVLRDSPGAGIRRLRRSARACRAGGPETLSYR